MYAYYSIMGLLQNFWFILLIVLIVMVFNLKSRVKRLEAAMGTARPQSFPSEPGQQEAPMRQESVAPATSAGPTASERFIQWLKDDWLLKLGGLLLLIGFGWLTTYAFLNNWIGPMGRIALGIVLGACILVLGVYRMKKFIHQGGVFVVVGSTTMLLTTFAARQIYGFFTPATALIFMFLCSSFVAMASIKYNNKALSLASIILAGIAPLLTNSPVPDFTSLFAYLFVVVIGAVWIVAVTGQREMTAAALILVSAYSVPQILGQPPEAPVLLLFVYAFAAVFYLTNTTGILKLKDKNLQPDLLTAAGNGLFLLAWIMTTAQKEWQSLIISAWMLLFVGGAFAAFRLTQKREPFYVYAGVGIAMLAAATAAELEGAALTIAFTIEAGLVSLLTHIIIREKAMAERMSLLFIGPIFLALASLEARAWREGVLHEHFFVLLILAAMLLGLGVFYAVTQEATKPKKISGINVFLLVAGSVAAAALLWRSLHAALVNDDTAVMIALLTYTIVGLTAYFFGGRNESKALRLYGGIILGCVIGRLLHDDVWKMELAGRIVTFFVIGILLMSTAFFSRKHVSTQTT